MIRVLIDGRVSGHDGIGRYTTCLTKALREAAGPDIHVTVLPPTDTSRYSQAESAELARAAVDARADIIHVLDFRIPVDPLLAPIIATVHDVLRLDPRYCHTNEQFAHRYGDNWLAGLQFAVRDLRERPGASRTQLEGTSLYAEYYARMLAWACRQASYVVTPTGPPLRPRDRASAPGRTRRVRPHAAGGDDMRIACHRQRNPGPA